MKKGTVTVNLKSATGYTPKKDETTDKDLPPEKVELMVKVTSQGTEDTVYKEKHNEDLENVNIPIQGVGTVTIKVYIDGVMKKQTQLNLNESNPVFYLP